MENQVFFIVEISDEMIIMQSKQPLLLENSFFTLEEAFKHCKTKDILSPTFLITNNFNQNKRAEMQFKFSQLMETNPIFTVEQFVLKLIKLPKSITLQEIENLKYLLKIN